MVERTVQDWLARANEQQEPAEVRLCLDEAARCAHHAYEMRDVLSAERELGQPERLPALMERLLEMAEGERDELHAFLDVAEARLETLADRAGAREVLLRADRMLSRPRDEDDWRSPPIWSWCRLGRAWLELLDEREPMVRCLATAQELCEEPDHLCTVAEGRHQLLGDLAGARALLEQAEREVTPDDTWTLANAWSALGDDAAAERVLDRGLRESREAREALRVASAWASHERPDRSLAAVQHAMTLAQAPRDWLQVAETCAELGLEQALIRQALDAAVAQVDEEDLEMRTQLSGAYHRWLGEPWSTRVGPLGQRPAELHVVERVLPGWTSDPGGLFDALRQRISPESLRQIAGADYGMGFSENLSVLTDLCKSGLLPVQNGSLPWHPHEVLALSRWARGERVDHEARALSATILSCLPAEELCNTVPYLVESALVLGAPLPSLAEGMLAWLCTTGWRPDPFALSGLALLCLARDPHDERLTGLLELLEAQMSEDFLEYCTATEQWRSLVRAVAGPARQEKLLAWFQA